jgi:hypothetical protein
MIDEAEFRTLQNQVAELRRQMKMASDWHDTLNTPMYKKVWFFIQGYKPWSLGTWYTAPWNRSAGEKYNRGF